MIIVHLMNHNVNVFHILSEYSMTLVDPWCALTGRMISGCYPELSLLDMDVPAPDSPGSTLELANLCPGLKRLSARK